MRKPADTKTMCRNLCEKVHLSELSEGAWLRHLHLNIADDLRALKHLMVSCRAVSDLIVAPAFPVLM